VFDVQFQRQKDGYGIELYRETGKDFCGAESCLSGVFLGWKREGRCLFTGRLRLFVWCKRGLVRGRGKEGESYESGWVYNSIGGERAGIYLLAALFAGRLRLFAWCNKGFWAGEEEGREEERGGALCRLLLLRNP